jgi:hypothetical protein
MFALQAIAGGPCDLAISAHIQDPSGATNLRDAPKGNVVAQIDQVGDFQVYSAQKGWWRILNDRYYVNGQANELSCPASGCWVHSSVIALSYECAEGSNWSVYSKPSSKAKKSSIAIACEDVRILGLKAAGGVCWLNVQTLTTNVKGWVDAQTITFVDPSKIVAAEKTNRDIPEECIDPNGGIIGSENCLKLMEGNEGATEGSSQSSSGFKLPDEVVQGLWIAFGLLLLFTFIMGATDSRVVFYNLLDFLLSLLSFVCLLASPYVVDTEYSWAEIPLLVLGIILFVRIIWTCILDNRSIVWGLLMSPLKIIVSVSIVLYPFLWLMEKNNQSTEFQYSSSDSRDYFEQRASFLRSKKMWSAILLALLALLIWIIKKCLNGKRVYAKRGWEKGDGWNFKMLVGKGKPEETPTEEN